MFASFNFRNDIFYSGTGIQPDIEVDLPEELQGEYASNIEHSKDTQLQKAIEILNK